MEGTYRPISLQNLNQLRLNLRMASRNSFAPLDDIENLKTGVLVSETLLVCPLAWTKQRMLC